MGEVGNESETIPVCDWRAFAVLAEKLVARRFQGFATNLPIPEVSALFDDVVGTG